MLYRPPLSYVVTAMGMVVASLFALGLLGADRTTAAWVVVAGGVVIVSIGMATLRDVGGTAQALVAYGRQLRQVRLPERWDAAFWRLFPKLWGGGAVLIGVGWIAGGIAGILRI